MLVSTLPRLLVIYMNNPNSQFSLWLYRKCFLQPNISKKVSFWVMQALHTASKAKGQSLPNTNSHEANLDCEIISTCYNACTCKGHSEVSIFTLQLKMSIKAIYIDLLPILRPHLQFSLVLLFKISLLAPLTFLFSYKTTTKMMIS